MSYSGRKPVISTEFVGIRMENAEANEEVLTVEEYARIHRCSPRTIRRRIAEKKIRKIEGLGRLVRIHSSEIARNAGLSSQAAGRARGHHKNTNRQW